LASCQRRYRLHGHYRSGQNKLTLPLTDDFLKEHFLTYTKDKQVHKVHEELEITDVQLATFRALLDIGVNALSYDDQQAKVLKLLESEIPDCSAGDALSFFYPVAINVVQGLAIEADEAKRKITKDQFLRAINRRPTDPFWQGADAALRRAAVKAQERKRQVEQAMEKLEITSD